MSMVLDPVDPTAIGAALRCHLPKVRATGSEHWEFDAGNGDQQPGTACVANNWLLLKWPLAARESSPPLDCETLGELLRANGRLPPVVKFALPPLGAAPALVVQVPLDDSPVLPEAIDNACAALAAAAQRFVAQGFPAGHAWDEAPGEYAGHGDETPPHALGPHDELEALCRQTDWPPAVRGGQFVVELDVPGDSYRARLQQRPDGAVLLHTDLANDAPSSPVCHTAAERLLLAACWLVRMVRASAEVTDQGTDYRWEMLFSELPTAAQLDHSLSALSVACQYTAREVQAVLQDEDIARDYLALQQWSL